MTAHVKPIVKTEVIMTDRRFDSTALPLFACSRRAAYKAEVEVERERTAVRFFPFRDLSLASVSFGRPKEMFEINNLKV